MSIRGLEIPHSLSAYYYTPVRPVFVAFLIAIGTLLIVYRADKTERRLSNVYGLAVICLALVPTKVCVTPTDCFDSTILFASRWVHYPAAAIFFLGAACHSRYLFSRTDRRRLSVIFKRLGDFLFFLIGVLVLLVLTKWSKGTPLIFCVQMLMVWLFALSWLLKGYLSSNSEHLCQVSSAKTH